MADLLTLPGTGDPERERFERFIVRGPGERDCWFWVGSLSTDAYGRFWLMRDGKQRVVRPNRYALMLELGRPLTDSEFAIHEVCDNPICVRATTSVAGRPHVVAGTQAQNLAGMGAKGRGGGRGQSWHWYGPDRAARAARSRALRDALRNGWDADAVQAALLRTDTPTLF
ncbi:hypothetical protein [Rhodococcus qingshengii]|uniref:hypothetical protein n=1 Tax=Rhodococcus qingshengii TaxID=334542 RepID=UPI0022B41A3B|nr:hypothetical protein [Rhodococcus qingshengii]MCZ4618442.1 hypothetical protein [Rhodococcus qingshengii]